MNSVSLYQQVKEYMYYYEQTHGTLSQSEYTAMFKAKYMEVLSSVPPPKLDSKGKKRRK